MDAPTTGFKLILKAYLKGTKCRVAIHQENYQLVVLLKLLLVSIFNQSMVPALKESTVSL